MCWAKPNLGIWVIERKWDRVAWIFGKVVFDFLGPTHVVRIIVWIVHDIVDELPLQNHLAEG